MDRARWIASYPKSGNTWVRMFLNAYITGTLNINHMPLTKGDVNGHYLQGAANFSIEKMGLSDVLWFRYAALLNQIMGSRDHLFFKTHMANMRLNGIDLIPEGLTHSAVYLVRDPRAVAVSWSRHTGMPIEKAIYTMNDKDMVLNKPTTPYLASHTSSWSNHVQSWAKTDFKTLVIRYEDLKAEPAKWFRRILEHYEIPHDADKLAKAVKLCDLAKVQKQEQENGFRERITDNAFFGGSDDWRDVLSEELIRRIEFDHAEMMKRYKYEAYKKNGNIQQVSGLAVRLPAQAG